MGLLSERLLVVTVDEVRLEPEDRARLLARREFAGELGAIGQQRAQSNNTSSLPLLVMYGPISER